MSRTSFTNTMLSPFSSNLGKDLKQLRMHWVFSMERTFKTIGLFLFVAATLFGVTVGASPQETKWHTKSRHDTELQEVGCSSQHDTCFTVHKAKVL